MRIIERKTRRKMATRRERKTGRDTERKTATKRAKRRSASAVRQRDGAHPLCRARLFRIVYQAGDETHRILK